MYLLETISKKKGLIEALENMIEFKQQEAYLVYGTLL
jgi:hypothetical protein